MIYAYSILKGHTVLLGNSLIHLAMGLTMLIWISIPKASNEFNGNPQSKEEIESFPCATVWYTMTVIIHFIVVILKLTRLTRKHMMIRGSWGRTMAGDYQVAGNSSRMSGCCLLGSGGGDGFA